jgi:DNA-binding NtrC family response regulator
VFDVVLLVEDEPDVRASILRELKERAVRVIEASTVAEAKAALAHDRVDLVILDVRLGAESGIDVATYAAQLSPSPPIIAVSGAAGPEEGFALAIAGVRAFIPKAELGRRMDELFALARKALPVEPFVKAQVGHRTVKEVQDSVRQLMISEALALEDGNKAAAARTLGLTRQALHATTRRDETEE